MRSKIINKESYNHQMSGRTTDARCSARRNSKENNSQINSTVAGHLTRPEPPDIRSLLEIRQWLSRRQMANITRCPTSDVLQTSGVTRATGHPVTCMHKLGPRPCIYHDPVPEWGLNLCAYCVSPWTNSWHAQLTMKYGEYIMCQVLHHRYSVLQYVPAWLMGYLTI